MLNSSVSASQPPVPPSVLGLLRDPTPARVTPEDNDPAQMSMSESLAHGLVTRLTDGALRRHESVRSRAHDRHTVKRAASYRLAREYLRNCVPPELRAMEYEAGDRTGKSKDAKYTLLHWDSPKMLLDIIDDEHEPQPRHDSGDLVLVSCMVDSRHTRVRYAPIMTVGRHALMRLFFRLRTLDEAAVFSEMRDLVGCFMDHFHLAHHLGPCADLLMPTSHGAFVLTRMRERPAEMYIKTWMNDDRMIDNPRRQKAVIRARAEGGVVLNELGAFPIISRQRIEAEGKNWAGLTGKDLNWHCDQFYPLHTRLPADWRFANKSTLNTGH